MMRTRVPSTILAVLFLAGCGSGEAGPEPEQPITSRAVAAVALEHLPGADSVEDATDGPTATHDRRGAFR